MCIRIIFFMNKWCNRLCRQILFSMNKVFNNYMSCWPICTRFAFELHTWQQQCNETINQTCVCALWSILQELQYTSNKNQTVIQTTTLLNLRWLDATVHSALCSVPATVHSANFSERQRLWIDRPSANRIRNTHIVCYISPVRHKIAAMTHMGISRHQ